MNVLQTRNSLTRIVGHFSNVNINTKLTIQLLYISVIELQLNILKKLLIIPALN